MKRKKYHKSVKKIAKNRLFSVAYSHTDPTVSTSDIDIVLELKKKLGAKVIDTHAYEDGSILYIVGFDSKKQKKSKPDQSTTPPQATKEVEDKPLASSRQVGGSHYKSMKIQPCEFTHANNIPHMEGDAIVYICRHRFKNGVEDIDKAIHTLQLLKEMEYPEK